MPTDLPAGPDSPPTDELDSAEASLGVLQNVLHPIANDDWRSRRRAGSSTSPVLTDHLMNSITVIGGAAGAELPERDPTDSVERQVVVAARPALDAWHRRGLDGTVKFGDNEAPARVMAGILSLEFLVHAWDYAAAMGSDGECARLAGGLRDGAGAGSHNPAGPQHRRLRRPDRCARRRELTGPAAGLHRSRPSARRAPGRSKSAAPPSEGALAVRDRP